MPKQRHSQRKKQQKKKFVPVAPAQTAQAAQPVGVAQPVRPTTPQRAAASGMPTASLAQPDTGGELMRIGILTGVIIVILVVLYFVLT